eukprot:SAG25_NODE_10908_length_320_cov_0.583710_1_plen_43_part_01
MFWVAPDGLNVLVPVAALQTLQPSGGGMNECHVYGDTYGMHNL